MADAPTEVNQSPLGFSALLTEIVPVLSFLRRWWFLAVVMTVLSCTTTFVIVVIRGVQYQVSASLFYKLGTELAPPPTMGKDPLVITRRAEDVNDEIEILTSPDLMHQVIQDLGIEFFTPPAPTTAFGKLKQQLRAPLEFVLGTVEETLIQAGLRRRLTKLEKVELAVAGSLDVELVRESDVISVTLDTPAPEAGVTIVQRLIEAYQARHLEIHQELAVKEFLTRQTQQLRDQLAASTDELLKFQKSNDLWSPEEQQKMLLDNRKTLQMQVANTGSRVAHLGKFVDDLKAVVDELPEVVQLSDSKQLNPAIVDLEDRLASLNMNRVIVETSYKTSSRESIDRQRQIQELEKRIEQAPELVPYASSTGLNLARQELLKEHALKQAELNGVRDQLVAEQKQLDEMNQALQVLGAAIAKFQHLDREHRLLEQKYALYTENFEKADISSVMNLSQISNMELISAPVASLIPVSPRLTIVVAAGVMSGLALAFMLAIAYDLRVLLRKRAVRI
ncbi:MAG: hypothetical protein IT423_22240 [Pirellulaceae bacterium]|nr:hypothetical protein [Pirellulaceae bacterium]